MIREISEFEKAVGRDVYVTISDQTVSLAGSALSLPRLPAETVRVTVDRIDFSNRQISSHGWAFSRLTQEPCKRIFLVRKSRIIATATPKERLDVRQKLALTYDNCGFSILANVKEIVFDQEGMQLLIVSDNGVVVHEIQCASPFKSHLVNMTTARAFGAGKILFSDAAGKETILFHKDRGIVLRVDSCELIGRKLLLRGWCLHPRKPGMVFSVGVMIKDRIIFSPSPGNEARPDVAAAFNISHSSFNFGFKIEMDLSDHPVSGIETINLIAVNEDGEDGIARITPVVGKRNFVSKIFGRR